MAKEKCLWKIVSENYLEKMASGDGCIALGPDKPCYKCDGTMEYAKKINCKTYYPSSEGKSNKPKPHYNCKSLTNKPKNIHMKYEFIPLKNKKI